MAEYTVETLPAAARRARETLLRRWGSHIERSSPAWPVLVGGRNGAVAAGGASAVVVVPGLTGSEFTVPLAGVRPVAGRSNEVDLLDSVGYATRLVFEQTHDATRFVRLAGQLSTARTESTEGRRALDEIVIVTTDSVPGSDIVAVHGDVFGVVVRARTIFSNLAAGLRTVAGGEVAGYTRLMTDTRNDARERLAVAAVERGANAVVAMRYSTAEVAELMSEVVAYGTAVTIRPSAG